MSVFPCLRSQAYCTAQYLSLDVKGFFLHDDRLLYSVFFFPFFFFSLLLFVKVWSNSVELYVVSQTFQLE